MKEKKKNDINVEGNGEMKMEKSLEERLEK